MLHTFGLSVFLPVEWLWMIPTNSVLFVIGRVIFFVGYHIGDGLLRAPGNGFAWLPAVVSLGYCLYCIIVEHWITSIAIGVFIIASLLVHCCTQKKDEDE